MLPLLASLVLSAASASPNLEAVHVYPLLTDTPKSCIAIGIKQAGVRIILDKDEVTGIQNGGTSFSAPDERRMSAIRSQQARELLGDTSKETDKLGCHIVTTTCTDNRCITPDWVYLIFYIFKQGQGRVWSVSTKSYLKQYQYATYGADCGWCPAGFETLRTLNGSAFLSAQLYVR
jgi:hypothetical protein